jgi:hypothetical protein
VLCVAEGLLANKVAEVAVLLAGFERMALVVEAYDGTGHVCIVDIVLAGLITLFALGLLLPDDVVDVPEPLPEPVDVVFVADVDNVAVVMLSIPQLTNTSSASTSCFSAWWKPDQTAMETEQLHHT